jgi:hypothetical protein
MSKIGNYAYRFNFNDNKETLPFELNISIFINI